MKRKSPAPDVIDVDDDVVVIVYVSGTRFECQLALLRRAPPGVLADMFAADSPLLASVTVRIERYAPGFEAALAHVRGEPVIVPVDAVRGLVAHELHYYFDEQPLLLSHAALEWAYDVPLRTFAMGMHDALFEHVAAQAQRVRGEKLAGQNTANRTYDEDCLDIPWCSNTYVNVRTQIAEDGTSIDSVCAGATIVAMEEYDGNELMSREQTLVSAIRADPCAARDVSDAIAWLTHATYVHVAPATRSEPHEDADGWEVLVRIGYEEGSAFLARVEDALRKS